MKKFFLRRVRSLVEQERESLKLVNELDGDRELAVTRYNLLRDIEMYVYEASYMSRQEAREKVRFFMDNQFDYRKTAENFKTSVASIQTSISIASDRAEKSVGEDVLSLIEDGYLHTAVAKYKGGSNVFRLSEHIMSEFVEMLPQPVDNVGMSVSECESEIRLLKFMSYVNVKQQVSALDIGRLSFLMYVLTNDDSRYTYEKELLNSFLSNKLVDDLSGESVRLADFMINFKAPQSV